MKKPGQADCPGFFELKDRMNRFRIASPGNFLLIGDGFSAFGTWIDLIAILTLAAYRYQVSSMQMAFVSASMLLPGILLSSTIGKLCDQRNPKNLLMISLMARVLCTVGVLTLHSFVPFLILIALRSVFAGVAPPAIMVMAVRSVDSTGLARFYSVMNVLNSAAKILAPALGTITSSLSSENTALILSACFATAGFAAFACVRTAAICEQEIQTGSAESSNPVPKAPPMLPLLCIAGTYAFSVFMVNNLVPLVLERQGLDKSLLGILISCSGAGNILTGLWLTSRFSARTPGADAVRGRNVVMPAAMQALGFGCISLLFLNPNLPTSYLLPIIFFCIGTMSARYAIALNVYMSTNYGASVGAAAGKLQGVQNTMILLAPLVGAPILDRFGGAGLFASAALIAVSFYAIFWLLESAGVLTVDARRKVSHK